MNQLLLSALLACALLPSARAQWLDDLPTAQARAKSEGKFVLMDFTGSDWCYWCKKMRAEVLDAPEFQTFAGANLILMEVDLPRHKELPPSLLAANQQLAQDYHVEGFPTLVVLNKDGREAGRYVGFQQGGAAGFIAKLEQLPGLNSATAAAAVPGTPPGTPRKAPAFVPIAPGTPLQYGDLALKGISGSKGRRMVIINNETLMEKETAKIKSHDKRVVVYCQEIRDHSVLITADGKPMELKLAGQ